MRISYMLQGLWTTLKTILPITLLLVFVQLFIFKKSIENPKTFLCGIFITTLGLFLFLEGSKLFLLPLGESIGSNLITLKSKWVILALIFGIGFCTTLVEPALRTFAMEVEEVSIGAISKKILVYTTALGFGIGLSIGIFKILYNIKTCKIIIPLLIICTILCFLSSDKMIGIAIDCASATTGPINIPLNLTIALGLSKIIEGSDPLLNAFGIVGLTSLGPIICVLTLGVFIK